MKKTLFNLIGSLATLTGVVWILQGINVLPGSFMTGQIQWAVYGAIAVVLGVGLLVYANRRKGAPSGKDT